MPAKSTLRRRNLTQNCFDRGIEMPPCSQCQRLDTSCRVVLGNERCGECVKRGQKCDVCFSRRDFEEVFRARVLAKSRRKELKDKIRQKQEIVREEQSKIVEKQRQLALLEDELDKEGDVIEKMDVQIADMARREECFIEVMEVAEHATENCNSAMVEQSLDGWIEEALGASCGSSSQEMMIDPSIWDMSIGPNEQFEVALGESNGS